MSHIQCHSLCLLCNNIVFKFAETKATLAAKAENNENIDVGKTQLQRRATQIPVDDDKRYKGKLISRKAALGKNGNKRGGVLIKDHILTCF